jgi:replicative DNA helicase
MRQTSPRPKPEVPAELREPPHALELERALLGAMIVAPHIVPDVRSLLQTPDVFWSDANAVVYRGILTAADRSGGDPFDIRVLGEVLGREGTLGDVGGLDYVRGCVERHDGVAAYGYYCRILREKYRRRQILLAAQQTAYLALTEPDLAVLVDRAGSQLLGALAPETQGREVPLGVAARRAMQAIREGRPTVYPSGMEDLDREFGGIPRAGVVTVTGVPGSGKSTLAANIALRLALTDRVGVRVFSYEMPAEKLASSMLAAESCQPVHRFSITGTQPNRFSWDVMDAVAERFDGADLAFIEENVAAPEIFNRCCAYRKRGVSCIVVDYIQNLPSDQRHENDAAKIAEASRYMQRVAVELGMLVVVVSQMTLAACRENRPPRMSDMEGSGAIMKVSDMVLGVYREAVFSPRGDEETEEAWTRRKRSADLHVLKNKTGPIGAVPLHFRPEWTRFTGLERAEYVDETTGEVRA